MRSSVALTMLAVLIAAYVVGTALLLARSYFLGDGAAAGAGNGSLPLVSPPIGRDVGPPTRTTSSPAPGARGTNGRHRSEFRGYLTYCPCMGRLGNQLSQGLGALALARRLNRTMLLPPMVEYRPGVRSFMVPWDSYFNVSVVNEYLPAVPIEEFLSSEDGERIWPPTERVVFCSRSLSGTSSCGASEGNPSGPFWEYLNVTFATGEKSDVLYGSKVSHSSPADRWTDLYPPSEYPVLAFTSAPGSFPELEDHRPLQKYVVWTDEWSARGRKWREDRAPQGARVVGVHLRNGIDWSNACKHVGEAEGRGAPLKRYMASPQCLGYRNEHGIVTSDLCFPDKQIVIDHVKRAVEQIDAAAVFVASDGDPMTEELGNALPDSAAVVNLPKDDTHLSLVVLSQSDLFVGNCVSSFTAIVARTREAARTEEKSWPTQFWAFPQQSQERELAEH